MKILIIGPLGAGKSSLAYAIQRKYKIPRLNIDEICRNPKNSEFYPRKKQYETLKKFMHAHKNWVAEGCQAYLYKKTKPDVIIDMRIHWIIAMKRYVLRFIKAKHLIGQKIDKNLPVQAYHYRKITFKKIKEYNEFNQEINQEIETYLKLQNRLIIPCHGYKDYVIVFKKIDSILNQSIHSDVLKQTPKYPLWKRLLYWAVVIAGIADLILIICEVLEKGK
ncbi:MAG: hypothetical protein SPL08_00725 [Pseudomonadota bacterium]|nr:hypothetical protein [Pseudomonadota bacterium]